MNKIHQILSGFSLYDAISNEALQIASALKKWGYSSSIYTDQKHTHPLLKTLSYPYQDLNVVDDDIVIYHFSIGSETTQFFSELTCKKVLIYHNITPPQYFQYLDKTIMNQLKKGREDLFKLKEIPNLVLADSEYNRQELLNHQFRNVKVLPIMLKEDDLNLPPNKEIISTYQNSYTNFLFVGRLVPNKKFEDLLKTFYFYQKTINPQSRLILAGSYTGLTDYLTYLRIIIEKLDLKNVIFTGSIEQKDLIAYYKIADIFLCMSEHEGFCVPLLEAMYFNVPIFALNTTAVPHTLAGSGVLIKSKDYQAIAEGIGIILKNPELKNRIITQQKTRLKNLSQEETEKKLQEYLQTLL